MANGEPSSGHGVRIRVTLDPEGSPNVFTDIDGLMGDIGFKTTKASKNVTPHSRGGEIVTVDEYTFSRVMVRDEMAMEINFDPNDADHIALRDHVLDGSIVGVEKIGPNETPGTHGYRMSGQFSSWEHVDMQYEGERKYRFSFRASGPFMVDGDLVT